MRSQNRSIVRWFLLAWTALICVFGGMVLTRMLNGAGPKWAQGLGFVSPVLWLLAAYVLVACACHAVAWLFPHWRGLDRYAWIFRSRLPGSGRGHGLTEVLLVLFWTSVLLVILAGVRPLTGATLVFLAFGFAWMAAGNYLGNARPGDEFTTQTKYTLADPEVWRQTHRLAGRLLFFWGFVTCILAISSLPVFVVFPVTMGVGYLIIRVLPRLYARRLHLRLHPRGESSAVRDGSI